MLPNYKYPETFSFSNLQLFHTCPAAWKMKYLDGVEDTMTNAFAQFGTLVHSVLEEYAKGELPSVALAEEYEERYDNEVTAPWPPFPKGLAGKYYEQALDYLGGFDGFGDQYDIIAVEQKFLTQIAGHSMVGFIDLILRDKHTGDFIVIDHKSKSLSALNKDYDELVLQLYVYAHAVKEIYGIFPTKVCFNCFREKEIVEEVFDQATYDRMVKWVDDTIKEIDAETEFQYKIPLDNAVRAAQGKKPLANNDFYCKNLCDTFGCCWYWHHYDEEE